MRAVLFATDFSRISTAAGRIAREAAQQAGAELHVVHVVPPITEPFDSADRLAETAATIGSDLSVRTALLHGRPARQIVEYARAHDVGLIVLGTHGRTGVSRAILGSVAEAVVRLAPCLVLTVPPAMAQQGGAVESSPADAESRARCLICAGAVDGDEIVCEACRARVRAEALDRKRQAERPARS
jgi:nucleotide-binding universal stress UspA family protein